MKKFTSLILTLAVCMSLCITASATEEKFDSRSGQTPGTIPPWTSKGDVQINVEEGISGTVYYVTVNWESMDFTYKNAAAGSWDPEDHTYSGGNAAGWKLNGNQKIAAVDVEGNYTAVSSAITVANHSNATVTVEATLNGSKVTDNHDGVILTLSEPQVAEETLANAFEVAYNDFDGADKVEYTLTVGGVPGNTYSASLTKVNTVTVTINP